MLQQPAYNPTESFLEGFLLKQGAKGIIRGFKKRWFVLVDGRLTYSRSPYSPELGHVKMEDCTKLVAKTEGKEGSKKYTFVIQTTFGRDYILQAATEPGIPLRFKRTCCWQQMRWMEAINSYHGMATNSAQPLLTSLSASQEAQISERARRRMTVMYPNLNMEEEEREAPRKRPVTMTMPDPQLSISSLHTDIAALASGLAHTTDNTSPPGAGRPGPTVGSLPKEELGSLKEISSSPRPILLTAPSAQSIAQPSNNTHVAEPRSPRPNVTTKAPATSHGGDDSADESDVRDNGAASAGDEEDAIGCEKDGKGGMGRQMSKLLKRKKDKKNDVTVDLSQRVAALEEQLQASEQQNEERRQAQEILNEELLEQRRRYDEDKQTWTAQVEQLTEKYFLSLVVSAKLNYMLSSSSGDSINVRAPALWEQAVTEQVGVEDFTNYIAQHIEAAAASNDRRRQAASTNDEGREGKVGYDHYYSYVRDDSPAPRRGV